MSNERLILAIGRMERALSKLEQASVQPRGVTPPNDELSAKYDKLKAETRAVLADLDHLIAQSEAA
ncbi:hypothetical protein ACFOWX_07305 [Sphingorhabdus arenilitoris]|uniref:Uncharacterized protein n=1 Tax=Sphingorhabdus arenilitoris TaxID=1490041 RepID=A0ABV8RH60_9SPHN